MAVKRIHSIEKYILSSSDIKPTDAVVGSEVWEFDTKLKYICYERVAGISQWALKRD